MDGGIHFSGLSSGLCSATRSGLGFVFPLFIPRLLLPRATGSQVCKLNQIHKLCKKRGREEIRGRGVLEVKPTVMTKTDFALELARW